MIISQGQSKDDSSKETFSKDFLEIVAAARASEALVLPILQSQTMSDAKAMCETFEKMLRSDASGSLSHVSLVADMQRFQMNFVKRSSNSAHVFTMAAKMAQSDKEDAARKQLELDKVKVQASSFECWPLVRFPKAFLVVDPAGDGHFHQLSDALDHVEKVSPPASSGWTVILMPGHHNCNAMTLKSTSGAGRKNVQLLGNGRTGHSNIVNSGPWQAVMRQPSSETNLPQVNHVQDVQDSATL